MPIAPLPHGTVEPTFGPVPGGHLVWSGSAALPHRPLVPPVTPLKPRV